MERNRICLIPKKVDTLSGGLRIRKVTMGKRKYSDEFKDQAIQMALESGKTTQEVADSLGVGVWILRQWKKDYLRDKRETDSRR